MLPDRTIPKPALALGWLGVLPFAALSLASIAGSTRAASLAGEALVVYTTVIVSFMGGVQWGLAMVLPAGRQVVQRRRLALSTLPALSAFAMAALPQRGAIAGLATVLCALAAYDVAAARTGLAPDWYGALRLQLTAAAVLCLVVTAAFGRI